MWPPIAILKLPLNAHELTLIERIPLPRGGFQFTIMMFHNQEPGGRGPPSKDLVQILRRGSSSSGLLIREHENRKPPRFFLSFFIFPVAGVSFDQRKKKKERKINFHRGVGPRTYLVGLQMEVPYSSWSVFIRKLHV